MIVKEEGIRGLYKGLSASILGVSFLLCGVFAFKSHPRREKGLSESTLQFVTYEYLKGRWLASKREAALPGEKVTLGGFILMHFIAYQNSCKQPLPSGRGQFSLVRNICLCSNSQTLGCSHHLPTRSPPHPSKTSPGKRNPKVQDSSPDFPTDSTGRGCPGSLRRHDGSFNESRAKCRNFVLLLRADCEYLVLSCCVFWGAALFFVYFIVKTPRTQTLIVICIVVVGTR